MRYTPILKLKEGELKALVDLSQEQKKKVTPVIQIVHKFRYKKNADGTKKRYYLPTNTVLANAVEDVKKLSDFPKVYYDPRPLCQSNDDTTFTAIMSCSGLFNNNVVPVLTMSDLKNIQYNSQSLSFLLQQGICLRVFKDEVHEYFFQEIDDLLKRLGISRKNVDIVFDYGVTKDDSFEHFSIEIRKDKKLNNWQSVAFVSGAFRQSLMGLEPGTHYHKRSDLALWKNLRESLKDLREIDYGDYAIQPAIYNIPVENSTPSRSIIYTKEDQWEIHKGQSDSAKGSEKARQYYAHAKMLTDEHSCYGENCCSGDKKIISVSQNPDGKMGTFTTWVQVGVNHHMALTLRQLSSLS